MRKITKIEIITRPEKLEELKSAMNAIDITGMTVTQVYGYGVQKGHKEIYRGQEVNINLLPKVKIEIVVCEVPVEKVLEVAKRVCKTGRVGDGKIFVYSLENAVRIRTGEEGDVAIMEPQS
ncbi:MAG: P-II family nitrogen regulator [Negativicutes bacterium]|nr:P-II family nitrogen regulator [Negativicutes bacterium]